jgi:hypothetical protein
MLRIRYSDEYTNLYSEFLEKFRDKPFFSDGNKNYADIHEALSEILNEHTNSQARADAIPWRLGAEEFPRLNSNESALAPSPGLAYDEYYSSIRHYAQGNKKIRRNRQTSLRSCKAQPTPFKYCNEPDVGALECQRDISPSVLTQCSSAYVETRGKRSQDCHDQAVKQLQGSLQQSKMPYSVNFVSYSVETLASIFHPCI